MGAGTVILTQLILGHEMGLDVRRSSTLSKGGYCVSKKGLLAVLKDLGSLTAIKSTGVDIVDITKLYNVEEGKN